MRKSIYLLTTTPTSHTHTFHPLSTIVIHTFNFAQVKSMDDNCGEWVECMDVASGCGEQEVGVASGSGWNLWVWLLGVVVRRYIDFLILLIPTPLVSVLFFFTAASLLFVHFLKCFLFLFQYFFKITFYVLNNFLTQYKHTYLQLRASHGSHMKAAHTVLYMNKHTQTYASYPAMDISCMSVV